MNFKNLFERPKKADGGDSSPEKVPAGEFVEKFIDSSEPERVVDALIVLGEKASRKDTLLLALEEACDRLFVTLSKHPGTQVRTDAALKGTADEDLRSVLSVLSEAESGVDTEAKGLNNYLRLALQTVARGMQNEGWTKEKALQQLALIKDSYKKRSTTFMDAVRKGL